MRASEEPRPWIYEPGTNVLVTTWKAPCGVLEEVKKANSHAASE
jgi:hypothetical protein